MKKSKMIETAVQKLGEYTPAQTAEYLGTTETTLLILTSQGVIKSSKRRGTGELYYKGNEVLRAEKSLLDGVILSDGREIRLDVYVVRELSEV